MKTVMNSGEGYAFDYDPDWSSDVIITISGIRKSIRLPAYILKGIAAQIVKDTAIKKLEEMTAEELLSIGVHS